MNVCFACGKEHIGDTCPYCGYSYSIKDKCPRYNMGICAETKKFCKRAGGSDYLGCEILLERD